MTSENQVQYASWNSIVSTIVLLALGNALYTVIHRLYFHRLASFPGPKLTAMTYWYEYYWDVHLRGKFFTKVKEMHRRYGPIVRINPDEIHVSDPDYFDEMYSKKLDKYKPFADALGSEGAMFGTVGSQLHRKRRGAMNPFFSKASINARMDVIHENVEKVCSILREKVRTGEVVHFELLFISLTMDIVSLFAFGESYRYLEHPEYAIVWRDIIATGFQSAALGRHFPIMYTIMKILPHAMLKIVAKPVAGLLDLKQVAAQRVKRVMAERETLGDNRMTKSKFEKTIFDEIFDSGLPESELAIDRLATEGQNLIAAGTETTTRTLSIITIHLLLEKHKDTTLKTLRSELRTLMPDSYGPLPTYTQLESLPYLTAIVKEALRLQNGLVTRLVRTWEEPLQYGEWTLSPGTPFGMTTENILMDERVFPEPETFSPERWLLKADGTPFDIGTPLGNTQGIRFNQKLDKYMVSFSKGPRSCAGIWLAYAEVYITTAAIFRRFDVELFETDESDVKLEHDFITAFPKLDSKGVRAKILGVVND